MGYMLNTLKAIFSLDEEYDRYNLLLLEGINNTNGWALESESFDRFSFDKYQWDLEYFCSSSETPSVESLEHYYCKELYDEKSDRCNPLEKGIYNTNGWGSESECVDQLSFDQYEWHLRCYYSSLETYATEGTEYYNYKESNDEESDRFNSSQERAYNANGLDLGYEYFEQFSFDPYKWDCYNHNPNNPEYIKVLE